MSGSGWSIPIHPLPGRRTATLRSVHRQVKRLVMLAWEESAFDSSPSVAWLAELSLAFGDDERPSLRAAELERVDAEGDDPDEYLPSDRVVWSDVASEGTLSFAVHNLGYVATELMEHWRTMALAFETARLDRLLRSLGYRRGPGAFPSARVVYYRCQPEAAFAAPAFCRLGGTYYTLDRENDEVVPYMDEQGEILDGGEPIAVGDLPEEDRDRVRALMARDRCGCAFCEAVTPSPYPALARDLSGWTGRFVDTMGSHGGPFLPLSERVHLAFVNGSGSTWSLFYRTLDEGATWECTFQPQWETWHVCSAACTERAGRPAALVELRRRETRETTWLCSTDLGATWAEIPSPPTNATLVRATLFENPHRPRALAAATVDADGLCRLHRSDDGGETWTGSPALAHEGEALTEIVSVSFSEARPEHVHAVAKRAKGRNVLVESHDAGRTFAVHEGPSGVDPAQIVPGREPGSISIFGSGTDDGAPTLVRSRDGGRSWTTAVVHEQDLHLSALAHPGGDWFWTTDQGRWISTDEGATWSEIPAFGGDLVLVPGSRDVLYAQDEHCLARLERLPVGP